MPEIIHIGPTEVMVEALRRAMKSDHPLAKDITREVVTTVTTCLKIRRPIPRSARARVICMLSELRNLELMELPLFAWEMPETFPVGQKEQPRIMGARIEQMRERA